LKRAEHAIGVALERFFEQRRMIGSTKLPHAGKAGPSRRHDPVAGEGLSAAGRAVLDVHLAARGRPFVNVTGPDVCTIAELGRVAGRGVDGKTMPVWRRNLLTDREHERLLRVFRS
jgi:hypothetical protein